MALNPTTIGSRQPVRRSIMADRPARQTVPMARAVSRVPALASGR